MPRGAASVGYRHAVDDETALDVLRTAARELADAATRNVEQDVPTYQGWSVADLVVHTGRIHRWVTEIVRTRATQRLAQPDIAQRPSDLIAWFRAGAADLSEVLEVAAPSAPVWTFAGESTISFWRRRMALETTIHRWDVQRAFGDAAPIADAVATAGITEALRVYLEPRLRGADVGGGGEVVGLRPTGRERTWAVRLRSDAVDVLDDADTADVWIEAAPAALWLFLMGRAQRDALDLPGPERGVERLEHAVALLPPPAR